LFRYFCDFKFKNITRCWKSENGVANCDRLRTCAFNLVNFGLQTTHRIMIENDQSLLMHTSPGMGLP